MNIYTNEITQNTKQGKSFNARINKVNDVVFYGDTTQETTTGNQLLNFGTTSYNSNINSFSFTNDILSIECLDGKSYPGITYDVLTLLNNNKGKVLNLSCASLSNTNTNVSTNIRIEYKIDNGSTILAQLYYNKNFTSFTIPDGNITYGRLRVIVDNKASSVANTLTIEKPLLHFGNYNTYEPYTGGKPAPSPDYPMEIKTITGENTISLNGSNYDLDLGTMELCKIGTYQDTLFKASGKNLFDKNNVSTFDGIINYSTSKMQSDANNKCLYIPITGGNTYTVSKTQTDRFSVATTSEIPTNNMSLIDKIQDNSATSLTLSTSASAKYLVVHFWRSSDIKTQQTILDSIMINLGTTALPYEPYGNYWYKKGEIGKLVLDGSEDYWRYASSDSDNALFTTTSGTEMIDALSDTTPIVVNYFSYGGVVAGTAPALQKGVGCYTLTYTNTHKITIYFIIPKTIASYKDAWRTWLSSHNVITYYVKATPTYERITEEETLTQLQAIENISGNGTLTSTIELKLSYDENVNYETNGEGFLTDTLEAEVVEQLNGDYYLDFSYKLDGALSEYLKEENVIKCKVANGSKQLFRIKRVVKDFDTIEVYAQHIFYDLLNNFLLDTAPTNLNGAAFGTWVLNHTNYPTNFTFLSDIVDVKSARYVRRNPVEAFIGDIDNSMVNLFGGDLERNNFTINLKSQMGVSDGIKLLFGKNIKDIKITSDYSSIITKILPLGFDGLMLPEVYVDSPLIGNYETPKIAKIEFSDIKYDPESEEEGVYTNIEDAYAALRNACNDLYSQGVDLPLINIKIDWVELSKTNEYRNYQALETLHLGDYITAEILGLNYKTRVIKINYNPLTDMVENFEIGSIQSNIGTSINANTKRVESINISSILQSAQDNATTQITTAMGGYVYKTHNELYIMDTDDTSTAQKVWRWNLNGLGYSENGINGPYNLAMTQDGQIVANFITTGTMDVSRIAGLEQVVLTVDTIKNDYFDSDGNALSVKTSKGFTFDSDGLNISDSETGFNTTIDETGTFYKEGNTILSQTTKDNTITKDLVLYGKYYYGVNENLDVENFTKDDAMFVGQLYADNNNEEGFGHFYNGQ